MARIVVLGGRGWFGRAATELLWRAGEQPLVASRRPGADLEINAESRASVRAALRAGDIVIDAAGPFQRRSTTLLEGCLTAGCDMIDLSDSLAYAHRVHALADRIDRAGVRVLTSCSSVSAVSASLLRLSGAAEPVRLSAFLAPATKNTSTAATAQSLSATLGRPIQTRREGALVERYAFSEERLFDFPEPVGRARGRLGESPDGLLLPLIWPTLRDVDFWVDTRRRALNALFGVAARHGSVRWVIGAMQPIGRRVTKYFGERSGGFGIEVQDASGARTSAGIIHPTHSYIVAVAPAVLAAKAIKARRFEPTGLVPADRHVDPHELVAWLRGAGAVAFGLDLAPAAQER